MVSKFLLAYALIKQSSCLINAIALDQTYDGIELHWSALVLGQEFILFQLGFDPFSEFLPVEGTDNVLECLSVQFENVDQGVDV